MAKTPPRLQMSPARAAQVYKMLSDEIRLRLLMTLAENGEVSVGTLCDSTGQSQPATSHHLTLLRMSGLVTYRRDGKNNFYSLASDYVRGLLHDIKC